MCKCRCCSFSLQSSLSLLPGKCTRRGWRRGSSYRYDGTGFSANAPSSSETINTRQTKNVRAWYMHMIEAGKKRNKLPFGKEITLPQWHQGRSSVTLNRMYEKPYHPCNPPGWVNSSLNLFALRLPRDGGPKHRWKAKVGQLILTFDSFVPWLAGAKMVKSRLCPTGPHHGRRMSDFSLFADVGR